MTAPRDRGGKAASIVNRLAELRRGAVQAAPIADAAGTIDQDHPLVRSIGADRAAELLAGAADARVQSIDRRRMVEDMSRAGRKVRDIAAATSLSERHVVFIRRELGLGRRP